MRVCDAGIDQHGIARHGIELGAIASVDSHIRIPGEVLARARRQVRLRLAACHASAGPNNFRDRTSWA